MSIRRATEPDTNFIFATWLNCYKHDSPMTRRIYSRKFFPGHQKVLEAIFLRKGSEVWVSCNDEDPNHIFGFLSIERPNILHFVYVKEQLRHFGQATKLYAAAKVPMDLDGWDFTHLTNRFYALLTDGKIKGAFNPYAQGE